MKFRALLPTLFLTGCLGAPPFDPPETGTTVPVQWTGARNVSGAVQTGWLRDFRDPRLDEIVATAIERNPDLKIAASRVEQARAGTTIATSPLFPQIDYQQSAARQQTVFTTGSIPVPGLDDPTVTTSNQFNLQTVLSWELDIWGRVRAGRAAAFSDQQAATAEYDGARLSIAGVAARNWYAVCEAAEQLQVALETLKSFEDSARLVRGRFERGLSNALDLRLALSGEETAKALVEARRGQLDAAMRRLQIVMGEYPKAGMKTATMPGLRGSVPAGLPAELIARRPDLRAAERLVAAARKRETEARLALLPRISLTGAGGTTTDALKNILSSDFGAWSIAANLMQPVFDGGRLLAERDRRTAQKTEAEANYVKIALQAFAEVEIALNAEGLLAKRERADAEAAFQAGKAVDLALRDYSAGLRDYLFVLEAQRTFFNARSRTLSTRLERLENRINLHLALGGDFSTPPPVSPAS